MTFVETAKTKEKIFFDSSETYDPDKDNLTYLWDFGNGKDSNIASPVYSYKSSGKYMVTLTVSDGEFTDIATGIIAIKAKSDGSPGFEILLLIIAIALVLFISKKRNLLS
jgi:hypothetical protein